MFSEQFFGFLACFVKILCYFPLSLLNPFDFWISGKFELEFEFEFDFELEFDFEFELEFEFEFDF